MRRVPTNIARTCGCCERYSAKASRKLTIFSADPELDTVSYASGGSTCDLAFCGVGDVPGFVDTWTRSRWYRSLEASTKDVTCGKGSGGFAYIDGIRDGNLSRLFGAEVK